MVDVMRPAGSAYPGQRELLAAAPVFDWIDRHFLRCDPFAFGHADFQEFALRCSKEFKVDPNGIFCGGSGAVGLSINPEKMVEGNLKRFNDSSDLDIAIISEIHFELAWRNLRERAHPALNVLESDFQQAMKQQKKRFFDGAIVTTKLLSYLDFGPDWIPASTSLSEHIAIVFDREIDVNFWIYRDYWSLRSYIANGIYRCKEKAL
ncbi:hypothetical protein PT015_24280 [Candidatus Mycobacterium wuenschmannii]|uniref:Methyltransferase n=1 Tax=Candidatus Mycobacterium wuenschmannii TaxID=3027808 RepID=A0ABY8VYV5_9MYCO|nr:hypothetical protein [Candidatus Mycobacterium wuenschmannii]WIM87897.1 hypothetical protein PT015_24280 [Candidatus Mycobacterium wuenschmannii]